EAVRVIGDDQEVERPGQLDRLGARSGDLLAPGQAIGVPRSETTTERARIHRERGVQVRVAKQGTRRIVAAHVGRKRRLGRMDLLERRPVGLPGVGLRGSERGPREAGGNEGKGDGYRSVHCYRLSWRSSDSCCS